MKSLYSELQWLPRPPADLSSRIKHLGDAGAPGAGAQRLAMYALELNQLSRLGNLLTRAMSEGKSLQPLTPFRLAVLSNANFDIISPALVASSARHGIALEVIHSAFDQAAQQAMAPDSRVNRWKPDAVLFALDYRGLPLRAKPGDADSAETSLESALDYLMSLRDGIKQSSAAACIFQTFAAPPELLFGSLDRMLPGSMRSLVDAVNRRLAEFVRGSGDVLLDVASLAETVGLAEWHSPHLWNMAKIPIASELIPLYAEHVARTVAAMRGKSRRVLILDLDHTLWGGGIGDDGLAGIRIAQGDALGEAYRAVQRLALDLRERGIVLAVCSKNDDAVAREPFEKHPEMLLRLEHIAVFQANWTDKATNIRAIAAELLLGLDAMVFLDDNPVERGLVRELLPAVAVPELPEDPAYYAITLAAAGYFEAVTLSDEDLKRASFYEQNSRRAALKQQIAGVDEYLASLEMTITLKPFDATSRARIVQLINKSNQYNLTTRRYTEAQVAEAQSSPDVFTLQARLADRFGDNGMISVVICSLVEENVWEIDSWLMSCRVLGRKVEHAVLQALLDQAEAAGINTLLGIYRPTGRNQIAADHYARLGFTKVEETEQGEIHWCLCVQDAIPENSPMKVLSQGFGPG